MHALVPLAAECLWLCGAAGRLNWIGTGFSCPGPSWTPRGACMCLGTHSPTPLGFHPLTCVGLFRTAPCPVVWTRQCRSQAGKGFSEHPLTVRKTEANQGCGSARLGSQPPRISPGSAPPSPEHVPRSKPEASCLCMAAQPWLGWEQLGSATRVSKEGTAVTTLLGVCVSLVGLPCG